jgi:DNA-binding response OmpR family regulator
MEALRKTQAGRRGARVLIVEDNPMIADLVEIRLRNEGMHPTTCLGGREGIEVACTAEIDLVILDVMMPEVDGYEVLRLVRSQERTRQLPVLLLTANSREEDVEKGLALGADAYITKPFSGADLVRTVKRLLEPRCRGAQSA